MKAIFNKRLLQHLAFWAFYLVIYTLNYTFAPHAQSRLIGESFLFLPGHLVFTYCQMYFLLPKYLLRKKYVAYFVLSFLVLVVALLYARWVGYFFLGWHTKMSGWFQSYFIAYSRSAFSFLPVAGLAISIKLYRTWMREQERAQKAEHEKIKMELEMLRSQLHPHFLFNTLNNLYSLTLVSSTAASTVVLHLSALLRYILYEGSAPVVPLEKELSMLKKYVELEKLRYGNRLDVAFTISGDTRQLVIAPLILLPFIENSFKHSAANQVHKWWINIHVHVHDELLSFQVINSRAEKHAGTEITGGIGLLNVKKRLALLYPGKHELKQIEDEELFNMKVQLRLERSGEEMKKADVDLKYLQTIANEIPLPAGR